MCTAFSTWQRINNLIRNPIVVAAEKKRAIEHLDFCIMLYREQMKYGRYFLHEHPAYASSWQEPTMKKLMGEAGVETATCDQCLYGSASEDGSPVKKPTTFLTNAPELAKELRARCGGREGRCSRPEGGIHAQCRGKTARMAAIYHFKLCRAILVGFRRQLQADGKCKDGFVGLVEPELEDNMSRVLPVLTVSDKRGNKVQVKVENEKEYRDDLTGQVLDPLLVRAARAKELEYFESKGVWAKRTIEEARRLTGRLPGHAPLG